MYRLVITAGKINSLSSAGNLADKNVHLPKLSHIDFQTLDEVTVLQALHAEKY